MKAKLTNIKVADLVPNPENPRKKISEEEIKELAASIESIGLLQPITVRTKNDKYEIVCGHRRAEAAKIASLVEVPCIIRELTDDEAYEVMVTENLQRKDIDPFEEADAFASLQKKGYDLSALADKFGKSLSYIFSRIKLNDLNADIRKLYEDGDVELSHCLIISRLDPVMQGWLYSKHYSTKNNWDSLIGKPVKELKKTIAGVGKNLQYAPFNTSACANCPKNTGCASLFLDMEESICQDSECYAEKLCEFAIPLFEKVRERKPEFFIVKSWNIPKVGPYKKLLDELLSRGFKVESVDYTKRRTSSSDQIFDISNDAVNAFDFDYYKFQIVEDREPIVTEAKPSKNNYSLDYLANHRQEKIKNYQLKIAFDRISKEDKVDNIDSSNLTNALLCLLAEIEGYEFINADADSSEKIADHIEKMSEDEKKHSILRYIIESREDFDPRFIKSMLPSYFEGVEVEAENKYIAEAKGYWYNYDNVTDEMVEADLAERIKNAEVEEAIEEAAIEEELEDEE